MHYRSWQLLSQLHSLFCGVLFHPYTEMEASCCEDQYWLTHPYLFITQSAPSQQVRNWKIHDCGPSNLRRLPSIMLSRFCAISENFFLFHFPNMKYEKSSKIVLCKWVLYNYRICFAKFKLKSELSKSSNYLFVAFIPFFQRGHVSVRNLRRKTCKRKSKKICTLWVVFFTSGFKNLRVQSEKFWAEKTPHN